jgi:drug/metabolite transporter (DMT)-like permease
MSLRLFVAGRRTAIPSPAVAAMFCLLWSSAFAVSKLALADCPPLLIVAARLLLAGAVMLAAAALPGVEWRLTRRDLVALTVIGVANNALYLGLNFIGMQSVSAGLTALIASANPVLTALLSTVLLSEHMTWRKAAGLVLGVGGVAFIVESRISGGAESVTGIACVVAALMSLVAGTILFKRLQPKGGLWIGNGVQNLAGGLAVVPFAFMFESIGEIVPSWRLAGALAFLTLLVSVVGYPLWSYLLTTSDATAASSYHFLMPPLGLMFGWLLLGERVTLADLIGVGPVVLGIYLITRPSAAKATLLKELVDVKQSSPCGVRR